MKKYILFLLFSLLLILLQNNFAFSQSGWKKYRGTWFEIKYPKNFTALKSTDNSAFFNSKDGNIEFYVFSPIWVGDPDEIKYDSNTESIVNTKKGKDKEGRWKVYNLKSNDDSYYRRIIYYYFDKSDDITMAYGFKYSSQDMYDQYIDDFKSFIKSHLRFAD